MKKIIFPLILLAIFLTSCGWDDTVKDATNSNVENTNENVEVRAIPKEDDYSKEIVQKEVTNMPEWVKDEMKIEEPKWIKFVDWVSRDRWNQKSMFLLYSWDFNTLKKEWEKLAKNAWLKLDKDSSAPKDSVSYSNSAPNRQGETIDWSKYLKSITILKAPDDDFDNIEDDYTLWISIMDAELIKN